MILFDPYNAVFQDGYFVSCFDRIQELLPEPVDNRHGRVTPDAAHNGSGSGKRVDALGEEHAGGSLAEFADGIEDHSSRCGAYGDGQAERFPFHRHAVDLRVVLVPAGDTRFIEHHGHLEGRVLAEIELGDPDEPFAKPEWLGEEVTSDPRYYNVNMLQSL